MVEINYRNFDTSQSFTNAFHFYVFTLRLRTLRLFPASIHNIEMIFHSIGALFVLLFVRPNLISHSASADNAESKKLILEYDKRICDNKPTCDLTDSVQKDRLTLKKRDCMCDFECTEYDDCCMDSQYFNALSSNQKKYFCHPYSEVYMVVSCPSNYQNQTVIAKCEKGTHPLEEDDLDIIIPVTSVERRTTYTNKYCALCNHVRKFESWDFFAGCGEPVGEARSSPSRTTTTKPSRTTTAPSGTTTTSSPKSYPRPHQDSGRKYESNTKVNAIPKPNDFIGGCRSEYSPCRSEEKVPYRAPPIEYPKLQPIWTNNISSTAINIRIEIGHRFKRQQSTANQKIINHSKYASEIDELIKKVKYNAGSKRFEVTSKEGKNLVCRFNSTYPKELEDVVRTCVPGVITNCDANGSSCPSYTSIVYETKTKTPYRNKECAICNGIQEDNLKGCLNEGTRSAASKDLAKTGKKSQDSNLGSLSQNDAISFS